MYGSHLLFVNDYQEAQFISDMLKDREADRTRGYFIGNIWDGTDVILDWTYYFINDLWDSKVPFYDSLRNETVNLTSWDNRGMEKFWIMKW